MNDNAWNTIATPVKFDYEALKDLFSKLEPNPLDIDALMINQKYFDSLEIQVEPGQSFGLFRQIKVYRAKWLPDELLGIGYRGNKIVVIFKAVPS